MNRNTDPSHAPQRDVLDAPMPENHGIKMPLVFENALTSMSIDFLSDESNPEKQRQYDVFHLYADADEILRNDSMLSVAWEGGRLIVSKYACPVTASDGSEWFARLVRYPELNPIAGDPQPYDDDIRIVYTDTDSPWVIKSPAPEGVMRFEEDDGGIFLVGLTDPDDLTTPHTDKFQTNRQEDIDHASQIIEAIAEITALENQKKQEYQPQKMSWKKRAKAATKAYVLSQFKLPQESNTPREVSDVAIQEEAHSKQWTRKQKAGAIVLNLVAVTSVAGAFIVGLEDNHDNQIPPSHSTNFDKLRVHINPVEDDPFIRDYEEPGYIPPFADTDPAPSHPISSFPTTANEEPPTKQPLIEDPGYPGPDYSIPTAIMPTPPSESIDEPSISVPKLAPPTTEHSYPSRPVEDPNENSWTEPDYQYPRYYRPPTIYIPGQPYIPPHTN
jgi:hypothetical protein